MFPEHSIVHDISYLTNIQDTSAISQCSNVCYHSIYHWHAHIMFSTVLLYPFLLKWCMHMCIHVPVCTWVYMRTCVFFYSCILKTRCTLGIFFFVCLCACQMLLSPCDFIEIGSLRTWSSLFSQDWLTSYPSISVLARARVLGRYNQTQLLCGFWGSKLRLSCLIKSVLLTDSFFPAPNMLFI